MKTVFLLLSFYLIFALNSFGQKFGVEMPIGLNTANILVPLPMQA